VDACLDLLREDWGAIHAMAKDEAEVVTRREVAP
jgi:hypothetical protein